MARKTPVPSVDQEVVTAPLAEVLVVASGRLELAQDESVFCPIGREPVIVGRSTHCALPLRDEHVSLRHARLWADEEAVWIEDLGSRNGTFVNGIRLEQATALRLPNLCALRLGQTALRFVAGDPEEIPLSPKDRLGDMVGASAVMRALFAQVERYALSDMPVLVLGETGTGKELVARELHARSPRAARPFVPLDSGALAEPLLESELFGHAKGAFTGAVVPRAGKLEAARGGTLFLDETGNMGLALQQKLLRVFEQREFWPMGSDCPQRADVRYICATNADIRAAIDAGRFRADLYHRIARVELHVPPLRARRADIPLLAKTLLGKLGRPEVSLDGSAMAVLMAHDWPGNVRELQGVLERAVHGFRGDVLTAPELVLGAGESAVPRSRRMDDVLAPVKKAHLAELYERHQGVVSKIAADADMDRRMVTRMLREFGLESRSDAVAEGSRRRGGGKR